MERLSATRKSGSSLPFAILASGCLIAALSFGPRSAMGFFQLPILEDTGWDRTTFAMAMAIQNLMWGVGQPLFGALADRYGTWRIMALAGLLYAGGLFMMATASSPGWFYIGGGVFVGLGVGASSFGLVLAAFARNVAPERRTIAFGFGTAAGSAGMFLFAPLSQQMIDQLGWSDTLIWLSIAMLAIPLLAIPLRGDSGSGNNAQIAYRQTTRQALSEALGHRSYLLLISGFFVCGFQVAFITAHFPAYISDLGFSNYYAVLAISLIGFFNIIGSLASGVIGQKYSKVYFLALLYVGRSIAISAFLLLPKSPTSIIIFSVVMGLMWLSTVAPTNALVAVMFGTGNMGLLGGIVFFSHQIGSFLGIWLGGFLYDRFGSFDAVWWIGVALGLFAAMVHWPIREMPITRPALVPAG